MGHGWRYGCARKIQSLVMTRGCRRPKARLDGLLIDSRVCITETGVASHDETDRAPPLVQSFVTALPIILRTSSPLNAADRDGAPCSDGHARSFSGEQRSHRYKRDKRNSLNS